MKINILTLFPDYFNSILDQSILKKALDEKYIEVQVINIREYATDKHKITDERPFGGGPGMVMKVEPIFNALKAHNISRDQIDSQVLLTSAKGNLFGQKKAQKLSRLTGLTLICGHYEGVDERVSEKLVDEEIRIGNYVLTGGEPAAAVIIDAVTRLIPGVLGNEESNKNESHSSQGYFSHPQYTRPETFNNWAVPKVLVSGNHKKIEEWRKAQSKK